VFFDDERDLFRTDRELPRVRQGVRTQADAALVRIGGL